MQSVIFGKIHHIGLGGVNGCGIHIIMVRGTLSDGSGIHIIMVRGTLSDGSGFYRTVVQLRWLQWGCCGNSLPLLAKFLLIRFDSWGG